MFLIRGFSKCDLLDLGRIFLAGDYMLKVNDRNSRTRCEICLRLTTKTPERRRSGVFIFKLL